MEEWRTGIFTIMAMLGTFIGIILATRFIYVDGRYSQLIRLYQKRAESGMASRDEGTGASGGPDPYGGMPSAGREIGRLRYRQNNNRTEGIIIDFASLSSVLILGLAALYGVFSHGAAFALLTALLIALLAMPMAHFLTHVATLQRGAAPA